MLKGFGAIFVFFLFSLIFVALNMLLSKLLSLGRTNPIKSIPYECGEVPTGTPWISFNSRYFFFALVFLIFDVEIAFMYPVAVVFKSWIANGLGWLAFLEISLFAGFLVFGLLYLWKRGDLAWLRDNLASRPASGNIPGQMPVHDLKATKPKKQEKR